METSASLQGIFVPLLWIVFLGAAIVSAMVGIILAYHWIRFGAAPTITLFTLAAYATGSVILLGLMLGSIIALSM